MSNGHKGASGSEHDTSVLHEDQTAAVRAVVQLAQSLQSVLASEGAQNTTTTEERAASCDTGLCILPGAYFFYGHSIRVADPVHFRPDPAPDSDPAKKNFKNRILIRILLALTKNQFTHLNFFRNFSCSSEISAILCGASGSMLFGGFFWNILLDQQMLVILWKSFVVSRAICCSTGRITRPKTNHCSLGNDPAAPGIRNWWVASHKCILLCSSS